MLYRPLEECGGAWHRYKNVGLYSIIGLGEWGWQDGGWVREDGCLTEARSHGALVFFLLFLALVVTLFSRAGQFEQFW